MTTDEAMDYPTLLVEFAKLKRQVYAFDEDLTLHMSCPYPHRFELLNRIEQLEQRVNDLAAQLAQHEAAPYPHVRYTIRDLGVIVADGLDAALADYDPAAQMDTPILDDAQADACELTAAQRERIWARVVDATNGEAREDGYSDTGNSTTNETETRYPRLPGESYGQWWARVMNGDGA